MIPVSPIGSLFAALSFAALVACSGQHPASNDAGDEADHPADALQDRPTNGGTKLPGEAGSTSGLPPTDPAPSIADSPALPDGDVETVPANCTSTGIRGNGQITRTTRNATGFKNVASGISGNVVIQEGSIFRVQVETDSNVQAALTTDVNGNDLLIDSKSSYCTHRMRIIVTMPAFRSARLDGSGNIDITKQTAASDVDLVLTGSGDMRFAGDARALRVTLSGSGSIRLTGGAAASTTVDLSGSGNVDAKSFSTGTTSQSVTGSGNFRF